MSLDIYYPNRAALIAPRILYYCPPVVLPVVVLVPVLPVLEPELEPEVDEEVAGPSV